MMKQVAILLLCVASASAVDNGLGLSPAMGYNTWNDFRCNNINAANIKAVADAMIKNGLASIGYEYLNIDDCWAVSRDNTTNELVADPTAFPLGIKDVADYVHSKGLKFGIYTDRGTQTCAGRPASYGYEVIDAKTFASWGVDYLKEDSCHATSDHNTAFQEYGRMRDALNATGRPIYFSLCGWNSWYAPPGWGLGNSWRIAGDCNAWPSVYNAIRTNEALYNFSRPGGWNDPDMLVGSSPHAAVHNTEDQSRTQFSLWSVMAAPLIVGSNMLNLSAYDLETYSNKEVIAIDQDALGQQGYPIVNTCPPFEIDFESGKVPSVSAVPACQQIWKKPLSDGSVAVLFVNYADTAANMTCDAACFQALGMTQAAVRDVWAHQDLGSFSTFSSAVAADGASKTFVFKRA